jgi:hypothetical protein
MGLFSPPLGNVFTSKPWNKDFLCLRRGGTNKQTAGGIISAQKRCFPSCYRMKLLTFLSANGRSLLTFGESHVETDIAQFSVKQRHLFWSDALSHGPCFLVNTTVYSTFNSLSVLRERQKNLAKTNNCNLIDDISRVFEFKHPNN